MRKNNKANERLGQTNYNHHNQLMKIIKYNNQRDIIVEFQDEIHYQVHTNYQAFIKGNVAHKNYDNRVGMETINKEGYIMKIIAYDSVRSITVEFQDQYKAKVHSSWDNFQSGVIENPYHPNVCNVGITGNKYSTDSKCREYATWKSMIKRCFDNQEKEKHQTYKDVTCCNEWLLYENFYEWIHSQENFNKWKENEKWDIDKDILIKGNKIYSSETCCLVPQSINVLFVTHYPHRGNCLIGTYYDSNRNQYVARCSNTYDYPKKTGVFLGRYTTQLEAFNAYKKYKENLIKRIAKDEFAKGNITEQCYNAMINYEVEITD
jgi:hypothetical protein